MQKDKNNYQKSINWIPLRQTFDCIYFEFDLMQQFREALNE